MILAAIAVASLCTLLAVRSFGIAVPALVGALLVLSVGNMPLLGGGEVTGHSGIAPPAPTIFTYSAVFIALGLLALLSGRAKTGKLHFLFLALVILGGFFAWPGSDYVTSGILQYVTAIAAWLAGTYVASTSVRSGEHDSRIALGVFLVIAVQLAASLLQMAGVTISIFGASLVTEAPNNRAMGTFGHPTGVGKFLFVLLILVLPLLKSLRPSARRLAVASIGASLLIIALSQSRANLLAYVSALLIWIVVVKGGYSLGSKMRVLVGVLAVTLPFASLFLSRFTEDPDGGDRPELLQAGIDQILSSPILGTGPNNYVNVVSRTDLMTAVTGYPVHNTFLLSAAELGIPLMLLLFIPVIAAWVRPLVRAVRGDAQTLAGYALVCTVPGMLLITLTGWGMLNRELLPLWFFLTALAVARMRSDPIYNRPSTRPLAPSLGPAGSTRVMIAVHGEAPRSDPNTSKSTRR